MCQQQGTQLGASLLRSLMERSECPLICGIHTRVVLDQQSRNIHMLRKSNQLVLQATYRHYLSSERQRLFTHLNRCCIQKKMKPQYSLFIDKFGLRNHSKPIIWICRVTIRNMHRIEKITIQISVAAIDEITTHMNSWLSVCYLLE